jgi:hypothetical protein
VESVTAVVENVALAPDALAVVVKLTVVPGTGLPFASVTSTINGDGNRELIGVCAMLCGMLVTSPP